MIGGGGAGRGGLVLLVHNRLCIMQWMIFKVMRPPRIPTNLTTMACMTTSNGCHGAEMTRWWCYLWRQVNLQEPNGEDLWLFDENHLYHLSLIFMMVEIQPDVSLEHLFFELSLFFACSSLVHPWFFQGKFTNLRFWDATPYLHDDPNLASEKGFVRLGGGW